MAKVTGNSADYQNYSQIFQEAVEEFNQGFYSYNDHSYDAGVQTTYVMPVYLGLIPEYVIKLCSSYSQPKRDC